MNKAMLISRGVPIFAMGGVIAAVCGGWTKQQTQPPPPPLGAPIQGISQPELTAWRAGLNAFLRPEGPADGLGPVFNARSCVECHRAGAPGGASTDLGVSRVTRIGGIVNGVYSDLTNVGGPLMQARSLREVNPNYPFPGERPPVGTLFVSRRMTTPLFGLGLIEAIPGSTISANSAIARPDGIHGVPNLVFNPETNTSQIGRFGWKGHVSSLHLFSADAALNEIGITNPTFKVDNLPQGNPDPRGSDHVTDPENGGADVANFTVFMRFTSPPPTLPQTAQMIRGSQLFNTMNCAACHIPTMQTGASYTPTLANKPVNLYSDLLLHHMGAGLADGIRMGTATGDQWKTAPLWGLRFRPFYLHDGRASTVEQAILQHGGEATAARNRYQNLTPLDKAAVLAFLGGI